MERTEVDGTGGITEVVLHHRKGHYCLLLAILGAFVHANKTAGKSNKKDCNNGVSTQQRQQS